MPGNVAAIFEAIPWRHRAFCPMQLRDMMKQAYSVCGKSRSFGWLTHAQLMDLAFKKLTRRGRPLDPDADADVRYANRAIALLHDTLPAVLLVDGRYKLRGFTLESGSHSLKAKDMVPERRRLLSRRRKTKRDSRSRCPDKVHLEKSRKTHLPGDSINVASYENETLTGRPSTATDLLPSRAASRPRLKPDKTLPLNRVEVRCSDIAQINLLIQDRQKDFNRERLANRHPDGLSLEQSLLASPATGVALDVDLGSPDRSVAASAPADAPKVAPDDLGLDPLLSLGGEQTPNTDCTGLETLSLEDRLKRLAAMDDGLEDGLSAAEYTQAEYAADFGESCGRQTPRHGGMPTVPITPGLPVTPVFMAQFKQQYPEFAGLNIRVLVREGLTQSHLAVAAAGTRRSKSQDRRPGMVIHGARMLRDAVWGARSDYIARVI
jgi:hypothetical protein